jgi:hypothetical protein
MAVDDPKAPFNNCCSNVRFIDDWVEHLRVLYVDQGSMQQDQASALTSQRVDGETPGPTL